MRLEINLKDPLSCENCPLMNITHELGIGNIAYCKFYKEKLGQGMAAYKPPRLKTCLRQNGE